MAYAIPDVPSQITEQLAKQAKQDKELKLAKLGGVRMTDSHGPGPSFLVKI